MWFLYTWNCYEHVYAGQKCWTSNWRNDRESLTGQDQDLRFKDRRRQWSLNDREIPNQRETCVDALDTDPLFKASNFFPQMMEMTLMRLSKRNVPWEMHVVRRVVKKDPQEVAARVIKKRNQNRNLFYLQEEVASEQFCESSLALTFYWKNSDQLKRNSGTHFPSWIKATSPKRNQKFGFEGTESNLVSTDFIIRDTQERI